MIIHSIGKFVAVIPQSFQGYFLTINQNNLSIFQLFVRIEKLNHQFLISSYVKFQTRQILFVLIFGLIFLIYQSTQILLLIVRSLIPFSS